ncbi:t-SNARE [Exidia glandulosa HHB12029]|uniref:t-SNARE n=1 Tax=Exidia glandulosa HHB12029 TaxID=1314781 RepID=A0A165KMK1_EXIGL|nr:t-SNARE [Exidia glandulosa HHB12029]
MLFRKLSFYGSPRDSQQAKAVHAKLIEDFLNEVSLIQQLILALDAEIAALGKLRTQSYTLFPGRNSNSNSGEDEASVALGVACLVREIHARLRVAPDIEVPIMQRAQADVQIGALGRQFVAALRTYCVVERDAHVKVRARIERQLRVIKPDATPEQVHDAVESGPGPIFSQALLSSNRYSRSRAAYREVQMRRRELNRIDRSLQDVFTLLQQMNVNTDTASDEEKADLTVRSLLVDDGHEDLDDVIEQKQKRQIAARRK